MSKDNNGDWVERTYVEFGNEIFDILTAPPEFYKQTEKQIRFIDSIIKDFHHSAVKILDAPCGDGRISHGLSKLGYRGTGIDISPDYIKKARKINKSGDFEFQVGDMRELDYLEVYDIVINWFGSFGYFEQQTNREILKKFHSALKEEGILIMDLTNRDSYIKKMGGFLRIEPELVTRSGDKIFYTKYYFDPLKSQIKTVTRIGENGPEVEYYMFYYSIHEILKIIKDSNFEVLKVYGDYEGNDFIIDSPRIIATARR